MPHLNFCIFLVLKLIFSGPQKYFFLSKKLPHPHFCIFLLLKLIFSGHQKYFFGAKIYLNSTFFRASLLSFFYSYPRTNTAIVVFLTFIIGGVVRYKLAQLRIQKATYYTEQQRHNPGKQDNCSPVNVMLYLP